MFLLNDCVLFSDRFNVSPVKYAMMFSFENIYGVFRPKKKATTDSREYDLIMYDYHNNNSPGDVLVDLCFFVLSDKNQLRMNDIISIRVNGKLFCYRYIKKIGANFQSSVFECFELVPNFLFDEISDYLKQIHSEGCVLSILDGRILFVHDLLNCHVYCIKSDVSYYTNGSSSFYYSVLCLFKSVVSNINPGGFPFISLNNAFYHYKKCCNKNVSSILVYDRYELEMIKDYYELYLISASKTG